MTSIFYSLSVIRCIHPDAHKTLWFIEQTYRIFRKPLLIFGQLRQVGSTAMMSTTKRNLRYALAMLCTSSVLTLSAPLPHADAQELTGYGALFQDQTPIEMMASNYMTFETGYLQPRGSLFIQFGSHQSTAGAATGTQVYEGRVDWALADRWQVGAFTGIFDDPPLFCGLPGCNSNLTMLSSGATLKYQLSDQPRFAGAVAGSLEALYLAGALYDNDGDDSTHMVGSVQLPMSVLSGDALRLHLSPGLSILPDKINGVDYYGTIPWVGLGFTFAPVTGLQAYANINLPFADRGNVIAQDGRYKNVPVWTAGLRIGVTPKAAIDMFATNAWGASPATGILALSSDASDLAFGIRLDYTPFVGTARRDLYFDTYRASQLIPVTLRDQQLQVDGFTLASAATYSPKTFVAEAGYGSQDAIGTRFFYAPDQDVQLEVHLVNNPASSPDSDAEQIWQDEWSYMIGGKLRLLDQNYGDLMSLAGRVLAGRDFKKPTVGVFYASMPTSFDFAPAFTLNIDPRGAVYHDETIWGIGTGINYDIIPGLQLIGEYTYVNGGGDDIWAAGARYFFGKSGFSTDIYATNAATFDGPGTLTALDDARYGLSARLRF